MHKTNTNVQFSSKISKYVSKHHLRRGGVWVGFPVGVAEVQKNRRDQPMASPAGNIKSDEENERWPVGGFWPQCMG